VPFNGLIVFILPSKSRLLSGRVPALLSDGEFVMPIGAVKKFGLDRLEKMRQAGLEFEKTLGIAKA
jgi:hypothetical protein